MRYVSVSEDQDYFKQNKCINKYPKVKIQFYPFAKHTESFYNVIRYNMINRFKEMILQHISEKELPTTHHMNLLLSEPIKEFNKGHPIFRNKHERLLKKKIKDFNKIQKDYIQFIKELLEKGIQEYKQKKIKPYFLDLKKSK